MSKLIYSVTVTTSEGEQTFYLSTPYTDGLKITVEDGSGMKIGEFLKK